MSINVERSNLAVLVMSFFHRQSSCVNNTSQIGFVPKIKIRWYLFKMVGSSILRIGNKVTSCVKITFGVSEIYRSSILLSFR